MILFRYHFILALAFILTTISPGQLLHAQIVQVAPTTGNPGQTLTVNFTDPSGSFNAASSCGSVTASNITFSKSGATSFQPTTANILSNTLLTTQTSIPGGQSIGAYNVTFSGGCPLSCTNCFTVTSSAPTTNLRVRLFQTTSPLVPGGTANFRIIYYNDASTPANNVVVKLAFDPRLTYNTSSTTPTTVKIDTLIWNLGTVPGNWSRSISNNFSIPSPITTTTTFQGKATISPSTNDVSPANNMASESFTIFVAGPLLDLNPDVSGLGQTLTTSFTSSRVNFVGASGCSSLSPGDINFTDTAGTYSFNATSVNIPDPDTAEVTLTVPVLAPLGLYNVESGVGPCKVQCSDCFTVNPAGRNLKISVTSSPNVVKGEPVSYTMTYQNIGTDTITSGYVKVDKDPLLKYLTSSPAASAMSSDSIAWNFNNLLPGATNNIVLSAQYDGKNYGSTLRTISTINPITGDIAPTNNRDTVDQIIQAPDLLSHPDTGKLAQTLSVKFTSTSISFTSSSSCIDPSNIILEHESNGYSFNPLSTSFLTSDTINASIGIPTNALLGNYDIEFTGTCPIDCKNCFYVLPDTIVNGDDLSVYLTNVTEARPGFSLSYLITYQNKGNDTADIDIRMVHDGLMNYIGATPAHNSKVGDTASWTIQNVLPGTYGSITVSFTLPTTVSLNTILQSYVIIEPLVGDLDSLDNYDTLNQVVIGSYDPNDKQVTPSGLTPIDYGGLNYRIRFQNTGTATAIKVVIIDTLETNLDISTIQTLAASHAYSFDLDGRIASWTFNNINLPDSGSDWLGSQGFVRFVIDPIPGLMIEDSIENFADIYFDFNSPIRTDTTINLLFDCDSLANFTLLGDQLCLDDTIEAFHWGFGAESLLWDLSGTELDTTQIVSYVPNLSGFYELNLTASNQFCATTVGDSLEVYEAPKAILSQVDLKLISDIKDSIQWIFNGNPLQGATNDTLVAAENGIYYVMHIDSNGCESISDSIEITGIGIIEKFLSESLQIFPNPSTGKIWITNLIGKSRELEVRVYDLTGKLKMQTSIQLTGISDREELDLSHLNFGIFMIQIRTENQVMTERILLKSN